MIPVFGNDWKLWARQLTTALNSMPLQLRAKDADASAAVDGVLMWDRATGEVVVSTGGAFRIIGPDRLTVTLGPFYINDIPGTATTQATRGYFNTATALSRNGNDIRMDRAGRVVGAIITSDAARTAGTATVQVRIAGVATAFDGGSVQLNATTTTSDSAFVAFGSGLAFTAGQTVGAALVTSGWTPITANAVIDLIVMLEPF